MDAHRPSPSGRRPVRSAADREVELRRIRRLTHWLDARFTVPGTRFRFGLDPLLGLIPGLGDAAGLALSTYAILAARRLGLPRRVLVRMAGNVAVDALVGSVPLLGDLFDFAFRANRRNLRLIEQALGEEPAS